MKKKCLGWLFLSDDVNQPLSTHSFLINKLSSRFGKLYLINFRYLDLLLNNKMNNFEKFQDKPNRKFTLNKFVEIKNILSKEDLISFLKNKELNLIYTNNFETNLPSINLLKYLNKFKLNFFELNDISNVQIKQKIEFKYFLKGIKFKFDKIIYKLRIFILSNAKKIHKNKIKFTSNLEKFDLMNNNLFYRFLFKKGFFFNKEIVKINSKAFDLLKIEKLNVNTNKIILLDDHFGHPSSLKIRGKINEDDIKKHYEYLNELLNNLQSIFKKQIYICIHPKDDINLKKKIFPKYEVLKYQTRENIFDAFVVLFFETTAIVDAIILKKNIITIYSDFMDKSVRGASNHYRDKVGITQIKLAKNYFINSNDLNKKFSISKNRFDDFINKYIAIDGNNFGFKKIMSYLENYLK